MRPAPRETYHHGDLRAALIAAADEIIRDGGLERFSLREAARRAGVSPGAPSHHFGGIKGLLTQVATLAFEELAGYMARVESSDDAAIDLRGHVQAYVTFAMENPGRFLLTRRKDLIDRSDAGFRSASVRGMRPLLSAAATYHRVKWPLPPDEHMPSSIHAVLASAHGMAYLSIEGGWYASLDQDEPRADFALLLPSILEATWPHRTVPGQLSSETR